MKKIKKVNGLSLEEWIKKETSPRSVKLWGDAIEFTPVICENVIGDGEQLVYLGTIDQRPYYWLIRIDSKTDINSDDFDFEHILEPLEEFFGISEEFISEEEFIKLKSKGDEICNLHETYQEWLKLEYDYPKIKWSGGHWGLVVNMSTGEYEQ